MDCFRRYIVGSGPLHYYPETHILPYVFNIDVSNQGTTFKLGEKTHSNYEDYFQEIIDNNKYEKKIFTAKKGDILIWHANLLHGANKIIDKKINRKSMVLHYFSTDSILFHEKT